jgi:tetratricopeptide (TPR) repeat protein
MNRRQWLLVLGLTMALGACAGPSTSTLPSIDRLGTPGRAWRTWLEGGPSQEALQVFSAHTTDPVGRFGAGEAAYVLGEYEEAWDLHAEVVAQHPNHALARWSALRLLELRSATPGLSSRTSYLLSRLREPASDDPATTVLLALLASGSTHEDARPGTALSVWRTSGPYGQHPIGDLNREFAPDLRATIVREPASSRTELATVRSLRDDEADASRLRLPTRGLGTYYAEAEFETNRAGRWVLHLELPHATRVLMDGVEIVRRDILTAHTPEQLLVELRLGAGRHRIRMRTAWTGDRPHWRSQLVPLEAKLAAHDVLKPGLPDPAVTATSGASVVSVGNFLTALPVMAGVKAGRDPLAAYLRARWAVEFAPADVADEAVLALTGAAPDFAGTALVSGRAAIRQGELRYLDTGAAQLRALAAWTLGARRHPDSGALALKRARALLATGRWPDAVAIALGLVEEGDDLPALLFLADAYAGRGWWQESLPVLDRARDLAPGSCGVTSRWLTARTQLGDLPDPSEEALSQLRFQCGSVRRLIADSFPADETGSSPAELALISLLRADPYDARRRISLARHRRTTGRTAAALQTLEAGVDANPWDVEVQLRRADLLRSEGRSDEAIGALDRALTATPGDLRLLRARAWADGRVFMESDRIHLPDTKLFSQRSASTVVVDRRHVRIHPDGATTTLFNRIVWVGSRADAEVAGAVALPDGALPLTIRTRKASGQVLDARPVQGNRLLLASLTPGDVAEVEYMVHASPRADGGRFWPIVHVFGDPRWPVERAELSVEFPSELAHQISTSDACCTRENLSRSGATTTRNWVMEALPVQRSENDSPDAAAWAPYVAITVGDEIQEYRRALTGLVALSLRPNRSLQALVETIRPQNDAGQEAVARSIFNWATRQVPRRGADLSVPASSMLSTGTGCPAVLTVALLRAAGIRADVALVRPQPVATEATPESFTTPVVRVFLDGEPVWLDPSLTYMPFAYLPPNLQSAQVLVLSMDEPAAGLLTPTGTLDAERRDIVETLTFDQGGNIVGEARLELRGQTAAVVREQLVERPGEPAHRQIAETIASAEFPGSRVTRFHIERAQERGVPLVVQFRFEQPFRGTRDGQRLRLTHRLAPQQLAPRYGLGDRATPLLVRRPRHSRARITVIPPRGWQVTTPMRSSELETRFGRLSRKVEPKGGRLLVEDGFSMKQQLVELDALAAFRSFATAVDDSSQLQIELTRTQ